MSSPEALQKDVWRAISEACYLQPGDLRADLQLTQLRLDSLAMTSIVAILENVWECEFPQERIASLYLSESVGDLTREILAFANQHFASPLHRADNVVAN